MSRRRHGRVQDSLRDQVLGERGNGMQISYDKEGASHLFKNPEVPQVELRRLRPQVAA